MENKEVFLLYEGDSWLSTGSLVLLGVFTSTEKLVDGVCEYVHNNLNVYIDDEEVENADDVTERICDEFFINGMQTQCYSSNLYAKIAETNRIEEYGI